MTGIEVKEQIISFMHCGKCLEELPAGMSPRDYIKVEVGFTKKGVQIWCIRHEMNVVHLDFLGQKVDYGS